MSTAKQETVRQHDALAPICERVFEEKVSGRLTVDGRPGLKAALYLMRTGGMLTVHEVDRLGRNLVEGLIVLNDLFDRGIAVKVLNGIAAGEAERSFVLDMALALAEDRRRDISRKTKRTAAKQRGGEKRSADVHRSSTMTNARLSSPGGPGENPSGSLRVLDVSVGTVWGALHEEQAKELGLTEENEVES